MKKTTLGMLSVSVFAAGLLAFTHIADGSVKGAIVPIDGGIRAWALSAKDTFRTDISSGSFEIQNVKPGTYRLIIEAKAPYKNFAKDSITVIEGNSLDVGEISLTKDSIVSK